MRKSNVLLTLILALLVVGSATPTFAQGDGDTLPNFMARLAQVDRW